MVDLILDKAGQKGTGKWTVTSALDLGVPLTLIGESAVFARCLSAQKDERVEAEKILKGPEPRSTRAISKALIDDVEMALYASKIISYAQGYTLMDAMAKDSGWEINNGGRRPDVARGLHHPERLPRQDQGSVRPRSPSWQEPPARPLLHRRDRPGPGRLAPGHRRRRRLQGIPLPLPCRRPSSYYDGYRCGRLPANLLQAQRDFFGAHNYERTDKPRGEFFHTNWTGRGGTTASSTYNA